MAYIGSTPTSQNFTSGTDYFSGTGSQTAYTLTRTVNSVNDIEVVINNVVQQPSTAYTLSGTTITFTSAPSSGTNNIYVRYLATNMQSFTVPANSITRTQLDSNLQAGFQGRNKIINGHMVVDQRNAGASLSVSASTSVYTLDRYNIRYTTGSGLTVQQSSTAPVGFAKSLLITIGTGASASASDNNRLIHFIEGFNTADLDFGTANAKTVTLSFWVRSSLTGTFSILLQNDAGNRSYISTYTINSANTWEQKSVTVAGDTSGTWVGATSGNGLTVLWDLGSGSDYDGTANSWLSSGARRTSGSVRLVGTSGATLYITGVQLEEGTTATSFEREAYSVTLQKCQRYFQKSYAQGTVVGTNAGPTNSVGGVNTSDGNQVTGVRFPVVMRGTPTTAVWSLAGTSASLSTTSETDSNINNGTWGPYAVGDAGFRAVVGAGGLASNTTYLYHFTANAEL